MKAKVIFLVEDLKIGGLERVIQVLAMSLDTSRYDTEVWCLSGGGAIADELKEKGITVLILGLHSYFHPLNILKLSLRLRKARPAIIHTHGYFAGTFARLAGLLTGIPIMFHHVHSTYWGFSKRNLAIERWLSHCTKKVICCSQSVADFVKTAERIRPGKIAVVHNGILPPSADAGKNAEELRKSLNLKEGDSVLGIIASLTPNKGHACLFDALKVVVREFPSVKQLIIGEGPCRDALGAQAQALGISGNIVFAGRRNDVCYLFSIIDIVVLPSLFREGMPVSLLEAMASAKPVVASKLGGISEVVEDGISGILVDSSNSAALASALIRILNNPEMQRKMGDAGKRIYAERFTARRMTGAVEKLYDEALAGRRA